MGRFSDAIQNEQGSVLALSMFILVVLTLIGLAATTTGNLEIQIAGNEKFHKVAFHAADGGAEAGQELLFQNLVDFPAGFTPDPADPDGGAIMGSIYIPPELDGTVGFWTNGPPTEPVEPDPPGIPGNRDFWLPVGYADGDPHTNVTAGLLRIVPTTGGAIQMAAGYEGLGKAAAAKGTSLIYDLFAQNLGVGNTESIVRVQWRHVVQ